MLAAHNERRRRRGQPEVTVADLELQVHNDMGELRAAARATWPTSELDQLLEADQRPPAGPRPARAHARGRPARVRRRPTRRELTAGRARPTGCDVARCLIIGCGCRGLALAGALRAAGHAVRGTTRDPGRRAEIEAAGAEAFVGDPDRVATLAPALEHVGVACVLLGSASGRSGAARRAARHAARHAARADARHHGARRRLRARGHGRRTVLLRREPSGCVTPASASLIPYALLDADPADHERWPAARGRRRSGDALLGSRGLRRPARCAERPVQHRADPVEQVGEDPGGRAPDQLVVRPRRCRCGSGSRAAAGAGARSRRAAPAAGAPAPRRPRAGSASRSGRARSARRTDTPR